MPGPGEARISVLGGNGTSYDVFEVISFDDKHLVVKGPLLFEIGERLRLKVERDGNVTELEVRIEAHAGAGDDLSTRIAVVDTVPMRKLISG